MGHPVGEMRYLRHFNGQSLGCFCYEGSRQELCIFSHCETWHMPNWNIQKQQGWMCVSLSDRLLHTWTHHLQSTASCVISLSKHHLETVFPHFDWTTKTIFWRGCCLGSRWRWWDRRQRSFLHMEPMLWTMLPIPTAIAWCQKINKGRPCWHTIFRK